jgi:hypothetical protein
VPEALQDQAAANPWRPYQPAIHDDLDALAGTIGTIRSLIERLATEQRPSVSARHVLVEAHLLRLLAESVYWNVHDAERWRGAPRCGRVLQSESTLARPCGHEQGHDGTCSERKDDIDDIVERARALATAAGRTDHGVASLSLAINRRRDDGAAVDAVARETLGGCPTGCSTSPREPSICSSDSTSHRTSSAGPGARRQNRYSQPAPPPGAPGSRIPGDRLQDDSPLRRPAGNSR